MTPTHREFEELDPHDFMDKAEAEGGPYSPEDSDDQRFGDWQTKAVVGIAIALIGAVGLTLSYCSKAHAHSFYDNGCCDTADCHPQEPGEFVKLTAVGWQIDIPASGIHQLVRFDDNRLRDTPMDEVVPFHICIYPRGTLRCFYRPGAAG